ncbi:hypothetical protein FQA39_LY15441 [Lamprigera yunnana]|nr:hypothetical protein FQA39_LY15441 [Lamprigera yunnana]
MRSTCSNMKKNELEAEGQSKHRMEMSAKRKREKIDFSQHKIVCPECNEEISQSCYRAHLRTNRHKTNACRFLEAGVNIIRSAFEDRLMSYRATPLNDNHVKVLEFMTEFQNQILKVKIISGKNLPVMDRSGDTTDAYVEIKLGTTTYKTEVCRKSLNPQWNSDWYRFEVDDSELQDEPLQIRLMDHDTYSANDAIGKVYVDLNPLLLPSAPMIPTGGWKSEQNTNGEHSTALLSGWLPVYDTMHGIRGQVNIMVKVELFSDFNKFRQSSCGVQFFCSLAVPQGYTVLAYHGFVEELIVNDDPEYQWIDKIRTPRASNEARQTLFFKLASELQRKIGVKALELGGNAVIGYHRDFDLEGELGVVVRGIGTAVTLIKLKDLSTPTILECNNEDQALSYLQFLCYDRGFYLDNNHPNSDFALSNLSLPFNNKNANFPITPRKNLTRHLSYNEFNSMKSNLSLNPNVPVINLHHTTSLQSLLQQEDLRGNPKKGIGQKLRNLKYSSQNLLSKKMTALKSKLSDLGMQEEDDKDVEMYLHGVKSRQTLFHSRDNESSPLVGLLVHSIMYNSLDCLKYQQEDLSLSQPELGESNTDRSCSNADLSSVSSSSIGEDDLNKNSVLLFERDTVSGIVKNVLSNIKASDNCSLCKSHTSNLNELDNSPVTKTCNHKRAPLAEFDSFDSDDGQDLSYFIIGDNEYGTDIDDLNKKLPRESVQMDSSDQNFSQTLMHMIVSNNCSSSFSHRSSITNTSLQAISVEDSFNPGTSHIKTTNVDAVTINRPLNILNSSKELPVDAELYKGNDNNMHARLTPSLRTTVSSGTELGKTDNGHQRTESVGAKMSQSPARFQSIPYVHRRSSDSDLSITPKGKFQCDDVCVLSASGTAAVISCNNLEDNFGSITTLANSYKQFYGSKDISSSFERNEVDRERIFQKQDVMFNTKLLPESPENETTNFIHLNNTSNCSICHLPYSNNSVPLRTVSLRCAVCRLGRVAEVLMSTIEIPEGIPSVGRGCFLQAYVCRPVKELRSELNAKDISDGLPFLEYELHRILVNKIRIKGMNAVFGLRVRISVGTKLLVASATGTGMYLLPLPSPPLPKLISMGGVNEKQLNKMQQCLYDTIQANKELYQLKTNDTAQNIRLSPDADHHSEDEQSFLDSSVERDCCILEVDDPEDKEIMDLLREHPPPDGFHIINTEAIPGLEDTEMIKNLEMFTQIWRSKIYPSYNFELNISKLLQRIYFKLRRMIPCALCNLKFRIDLPEPDEIQLTVLGMALELRKLKEKCKNNQVFLKDSLHKTDEDLMFTLEEVVVDSTYLSINQIKSRSRSPHRVKLINNVPHRDKHTIDITPLSYVPGERIQRYLGNLNFFFIRETTSIREEGGLSGFIHTFVTEVLAIVRAHIAALGGNAMVGYYMTECVFSHSLHKNQITRSFYGIFTNNGWKRAGIIIINSKAIVI